MTGLRARVRRGGQRAYGLALRAVYSRAGLPWQVNGEAIRIDPRVRHLVPRVSEPQVHRALQRLVAEGSLVIDVGAFVGVHAILAARRVGARGAVVAFEPTRASAEIARRHFAYNGLADRIRLFDAAVSDTPGRASLNEYDLPYVNSLVPAVDTACAPRTRDVEVITLDDVCGGLGRIPAVIRMDVQGAEIHALRGARETIRRAGPGFAIVVEMHPQCWPAFGVTETIARETIRDLGLVAAPLVPGERLFARDSHAVLTRGARVS